LANKDVDQNEHVDKIDEIDPIIHSTTRLKILVVLAEVVKADFTFLAMTAGLTRGNLSANLRKLEEVGYVTIEKGFVDRVPRTMVQLTDLGKKSLKSYQADMQAIMDALIKELGS
jgi:DNA-binding MarR family transcriptional regulator